MRTLSAVLAAGLTLALSPGLAAADPAPSPATSASPVAGPAPGPVKSGPAEDGRREQPVNPIAAEQRALRTKAMEQVLAAGPQARGRGGKPRVGRQYVELALERKDRIFTVLSEFGDRIDNTTTHNGQIRYGGTPGPLHNTIPRPDPRHDNHTLWRKDFDRAYYQDTYFGSGNSLRSFYHLQSSGRYDIDGYVSDWVKVPYNEARYGTPRCSGGLDCDTPLFDFVRDSVGAWYEGERARGRSVADITAQLKTFDVWDRDDFDNDGDFDEPDGYLDRFQVIHAGVDETWGGGAQGADALWAVSHDAYWNLRGQAGPPGNPRGGVQIGDTGIWVGKFLTAGENSGVGLIAHEYGHDLGLPDLYAYGTGGDNGVKFWSLMSDASYLGDRNGPTAEYPGDLDAWSKLRLGWLSHERARAATDSTHTLGVSSYNTDDPQAVLVDLPPRTVSTELTDPAQGAFQWWSGKGDYLNETLTRQLDLTSVSSAVLTAKVWYRIEQDFDYLYTEVSEDGTTWTRVGPSLTGTSDWTDLRVDLGAYAGKKIWFRFRYSTDTNTVENGFLVDAIDLPGVFSDDAENGDNGWTAVGFSRVGRVGTKDHPRAYLVENRRYVGYGSYLKTGPYSAGFRNDPKRAEIYERFPYQDGVLVWLWDTFYTDNNTQQHLGEGMILPIDARAVPLQWNDHTRVGGRTQVFDATFGLTATDRLRLHKDGAATVFPSVPGVPSFDDRTGVYWYSTYPTLGVRPPDTNTRIEVTGQARRGLRTTIHVGPAS
ncbi:immune inhibitor A domain-containing protein [Nonomuraea sp. NPDC003804]|uniref:immune inhibitor A domain-containing protein n=1 Tax=Nonomuraea sp. NPDC003804 TaxID=3154547 RepID=UPI0033A7FA05